MTDKTCGVSLNCANFKLSETKSVFLIVNCSRPKSTDWFLFESMYFVYFYLKVLPDNTSTHQLFQSGTKIDFLIANQSQLVDLSVLLCLKACTLYTYRVVDYDKLQEHT